MCDALFQRVVTKQTTALGKSADSGNSIFPLQHSNIDAGFLLRAVKTSKQQNVTVLATKNDSETTDSVRPGVHIYFKKAKKSRGFGSSDEWRHFQSIIEDGNGGPLNVDFVAVSANGTSIVALHRSESNEARIYSIQESDFCHRVPGAGYSLTNTLQQSESDQSNWEVMALNDSHTRMVVRESMGGEDNVIQFGIYERGLTAQRTKSTVSRLGEFTRIQTLEFGVGDDDNQVALGPYALSHNGQTLIILVGTLDSLLALQYEFDCEQKEFVQVSQFQVGEIASPKSLAFGGCNSERLFVLAVDQNSNEASVDVYHRGRADGKGSKTLCVGKNGKCEKELEFFSDETLVTTIEEANLGGDSRYDHHLLTDPINGDAFALVTVKRCQNNDAPLEEESIFIGLWRNCPKDPERWLVCDPIGSGGLPLAQNRCYLIDEFSHLTFDRACQRYCFTLGQEMRSISVIGEEETLVQNVLVQSQNGCYQLFADVVSGSFGLFYRVAGDRTWQLYDSLQNEFYPIVSAGAICNAKDLELAIVEKQLVWVPGEGNVLQARDPTRFPQFVQSQFSIPLKLCFASVCFNKNGSVPPCANVAVFSCEQVLERPGFGAEALRRCGKGKSCSSEAPTRLWSATRGDIENDSVLHEILPSNGNTCLIGSLPGYKNVILATHPKTGMTFAVGLAQNDVVLFRIDPQTYAPILISILALDEFTQPLDMSFRPIDEQLADSGDAPLYLLSGDGTTVRMFAIDISGGGSNVIGDVGSQLFEGYGFAIDAKTNAYSIVRTLDSLEICQLSLIDASTLQKSQLPLRGFAALRTESPTISSLTYDRCADSFYGLLHDPSNNDRPEQYLMRVDRFEPVARLVAQTNNDIGSLTTEARSFGVCVSI